MSARLEPSGQRKMVADRDVAHGTEPHVMPTEDAHANRSYFGRAGRLKGGRPQNFGKVGLKVGSQGAQNVQKAKRRRK